MPGEAGQQRQEEVEPLSRRRDFGRLLWRLADLVQASERRRSFRAKAYRRAVWSLDDLDPGLEMAAGLILATHGIGPGVAGLIEEYKDTGGLSRLDALEAEFPRETSKLRRLPRMTPATLRELKQGLGVETTSDLLASIESGAAESVRGVGETTLRLWEAVLRLAPRSGQIPAHAAWVTASELSTHIGHHVAARVEVSGAVRRVDEWVENLDLVVVTKEEQQLGEFLATTAVLESLERVAAHRFHGQSHIGVGVTVHAASARGAGSTLIRVTGPPDHASALAGSGPFPTEEDAYRSKGYQWIPAPARGLTIEDARRVVRVEDLRGDLHVHTEDSPDGRMPLEVVFQAALERGYTYLLVSDHTEGLRFGGLGAAGLEEQSQKINELRARFPDLAVFHGAEVNIGLDGKLDLDDLTLSKLDFTVAGVHSNFHLARKEQTARLIEGLRQPSVRVLAHPTGRRIGIRPPVDVDMEDVVAEAIISGVALECNGHRDRLDLPPDWVAHAAARGAVFAANSDAHRIGELRNIENAVATLQRAGVTPRQVINTFDLGEFTEWLGESSGRSRA